VIGCSIPESSCNANIHDVMVSDHYTCDTADSVGREAREETSCTIYHHMLDSTICIVNKFVNMLSGGTA
jgi:hypothetical protein